MQEYTGVRERKLWILEIKNVNTEMKHRWCVKQQNKHS